MGSLHRTLSWILLSAVGAMQPSWLCRRRRWSKKPYPMSLVRVTNGHLLSAMGWFVWFLRQASVLKTDHNNFRLSSRRWKWGFKQQRSLGFLCLFVLSAGLSQPLSCLILLRTLQVYRAALYYPEATNETKHPRSGNQLELTPLFLSMARALFLMESMCTW